ncbi:MAG: hypothetical protein ACC634_06150 [Hyphomicrobiales bacterium]
MADPFSTMTPGLDSPAIDAFAITPNDSTDLTTVPRALWVGGLGDVPVITHAGTTVTFVGVQGLLPVRVIRVLATGVTASNIVGMV